MDGGAALRMQAADGESIATLTISVAGYMPETINHTVVKDYSENAGVLAQLVRLGIVRDTGERVQTGWVESPVVEIIAPQLREGEPRNVNPTGRAPFGWHICKP
jgi:hypothetical protein